MRSASGFPWENPPQSAAKPRATVPRGVRRHVKFDHAGDERPSQVMQRPRLNDRVALLARGGEHRRVEAILHTAPARHGRRAGRRENEGTVGLRLHARNQLAHQGRERHGVRTAGFRSAARNVPSCAIIAQFAARHAGNFVPPLALSARTVGFRCRLSPFKSTDFCGFVHGTFSNCVGRVERSRASTAERNHPNIRTLSRFFDALTLECSDVRLGR
jgi:hypothetical protein